MRSTVAGLTSKNPAANWEVTRNNRRAKYYQITAAGRKQLEQETRSWRILVAGVGGVLETT